MGHSRLFARLDYRESDHRNPHEVLAWTRTRPKRHELRCVSCPWQLETDETAYAEQEARRHMDEHNHCVVDDRKED